jgi:hypothetical protein
MKEAPMQADEHAILAPEEFNERFTLYLNGEGKPVQRTLREMAPTEVLLAMEWLNNEANRLDLEAAPARASSEAYEESGRIPDGVTREEVRRYGAALVKSREAMKRSNHLMQMIQAVMPQWDRHPEMQLRVALRRFWPGGRAT